MATRRPVFKYAYAKTWDDREKEFAIRVTELVNDYRDVSFPATMAILLGTSMALARQTGQGLVQLITMLQRTGD